MKLPLPNTKTRRVLEFFLSGGSVNRFEAERLLNDHCLNTTVSDFKRHYGIDVSRKPETVPGYAGTPTRCSRYWLDRAERKRIEGMLRQSALRLKEANI